MDYDGFVELLDSLHLDELEGPWAAALDNGKINNLRDAAVLIVRERLMALATNYDEREDAEAALDDWGKSRFYEVISHAEARFGRDIVQCGNPSSMVSSIWGLAALVLDGRGFVYNSGADPPVAEFTVWARWQPSEDDVAYAQAVVEAWAASWEEIGLPPFMGEYWKGDGPLVFKAVDSLISHNPEAQGWLGQNMPDLRQEALEGVSKPNWDLLGLAPKDLSWIAHGTKPWKDVFRAALTNDDKRTALVAIYLSSMYSPNPR